MEMQVETACRWWGSRRFPAPPVVVPTDDGVPISVRPRHAMVGVRAVLACSVAVARGGGRRASGSRCSRRGGARSARQAARAASCSSTTFFAL